MAVRTSDPLAPARDGRPAGRPSSFAARARRLRGASGRLPLAARIAGANALVVLAALGVAFAGGGGASAGRGALALAGAAVAVALAATLLVVRAAHREERARLRHLAAEVIRVGDAERARIAHELHDASAQTLAALALQLGAESRDATDPRVAARLDAMRDLAVGVMEELRVLAHTVHPRVLDDLGLAAALQTLVREAGSAPAAPRVTATAGSDVAALPAAVAAALYRVAQEAVRNALRHGAPTAVTIRSALVDGVAQLEVADDGAGFDVAEAERRRPGMGLFAMRERIALVDGALEVASAPGAGTRVVARVPLAHRAPIAHRPATAHRPPEAHRAPPADPHPHEMPPMSGDRDGR